MCYAFDAFVVWCRDAIYLTWPDPVLGLSKAVDIPRVHAENLATARSLEMCRACDRYSADSNILSATRPSLSVFRFRDTPDRDRGRVLTIACTCAAFPGSNNFVSLTNTLNIQRYISINLKDCDEKPRDFVIGETNEIEEQLRQVNSSFNNRSARRDEITRMKIDGNVTSTMLLFKFIAWLFSIHKKNKNFHFFENLQFCRYRALEFSWFYMTNRKKNWKWESWIAIIWSWWHGYCKCLRNIFRRKSFSNSNE